MVVDVGHERVQALVVERPLNLRWTRTALADLDRFASFLRTLGNERLATTIARAIMAKTAAIAEHPKIGRPIAGSEEYREFVFVALNGHYVLRYRLTAREITVLRVFHGREKRD